MHRLDLKTGALVEDRRPADHLVDLVDGRAPLPAPEAGDFTLRLGADALDEDFAGLLDRAARVEILARDFKDGRVASLARHLRRHFRYGNEIVVSGPLVPQMADFLRRSGVDAVLLADPRPAGHWRMVIERAQVWFQFAEDARPSVPELRHGRSRRGATT